MRGHVGVNRRGALVVMALAVLLHMALIAGLGPSPLLMPSGYFTGKIGLCEESPKTAS
jgi:hypothetical protein